VFATGQGRKTDPADAHAIVMVALRDKGLRELAADPGFTMLRLLCDRRDELSWARAQALNRLHRLFAELIPGGAPVKKSTAQYQALLPTVRPRDLAGKTRRRMAAGELAGLERLDAKLKAMKAELKAAVVASGSHLMDIHGIADAGDIARFPNRSHFASWTGTAPTGASSGQHTHHRLSHAGNRRLNHVLHMAGIVQLRNNTPGRAYFRRRAAEGNPHGSDALPAPAPVRCGLPPARRRRPATAGGPGRALRGNSIVQRGRPSLGIGTSDQPLPGPVPATLPPPLTTPHSPAAQPGASPRRRTRGVTMDGPTGRTTLTPASAGAPSKSPGPPS
jgi:hypothetical protein